MADFAQLLKKIISFRDARDWKQFHTPRNLAESLVLEASEVLEHFQWKSPVEVKFHLKEHKKEFARELADVLNYLMLLADSTGIDLEEAMDDKLQLNEKQYPIEKAKGNHTKYTKL